MFLFASLVLIKWNINHIINDREPPCSVAREGPGLPRYMAHTVRTATKKIHAFISNSSKPTRVRECKVQGAYSAPAVIPPAPNAARQTVLIPQPFIRSLSLLV